MATTQSCQRCGASPLQPQTWCDNCGHVPGIPLFAALTLLLITPLTIGVGVAAIGVFLFSFEAGPPCFMLALFLVFMTLVLCRAGRALSNFCYRHTLNREQKQILRAYLVYVAALSWATWWGYPDPVRERVMRQLALWEGYGLGGHVNWLAYAVLLAAGTLLAVQLGKVAGRKLK